MADDTENSWLERAKESLIFPLAVVFSLAVMLVFLWVMARFGADWGGPMGHLHNVGKWIFG